jgi:hypothetical protein
VTGRFRSMIRSLILARARTAARKRSWKVTRSQRSVNGA